MEDRLAQSYRDCLALARASRSNFYYSFLTLPRDLYRDTCVLYAFMRYTDDLGDAPGRTSEERQCELDAWQRQLTAGFRGEPVTGLLPAMVDVARRRKIPVEFLHEVISGIRRDIHPEVFESFDDLNSYCYQVAGVVGECCIRIWGYTGEECSQQAIACGNAFQLTNILRDLAEDADRGRCYLPQDELRRFNYSLGEICSRIRNDAFRELMKFQVSRAWEYYEKAEGLLLHLSPAGRRIQRAMMEIYGGLLKEIERRDYDVYTRRISLPGWKKWLIVGTSLWPFNQPGERPAAGQAGSLKHRKTRAPGGETVPKVPGPDL